MLIPTPNNGELSLYFHLPFCHKKCDYCHFYVVLDKEEFKEKLLKALLCEIDQKKELFKSQKIISVYFGGGTPSLVSPTFISAILEKIAQECCLKEAEITLELNPENHSLHLLQDFKKSGINRLSIGAQTFDDRLLKILGRTHLAEDIEKAIIYANQADFSNVSIDLMYDLPTQTLEQWEQALKKAVSLPICHVSLYNLSIEPHTVFYKYREKIITKMPPANISLKMFQRAQQVLKENSFSHYEISAFCKNQNFSKHNVGYWLQRPHLGFGPSAYSFYNLKRFQNIPNLHKYCKLISEEKETISFQETLDKEAHLKESLTLHLRLVEGFEQTTFEKRFGTFPLSTKQSLLALIEQKLIEKKEGIFKLSKKGLLYHDAIASELI